MFANQEETIRADWSRYESKPFSWSRVFFKVFVKSYVSTSSISFAFLFWMRMYRSKNAIIHDFARVKLARFAIKYGVDVSPNASIGPAAYFPHVTAGVVFRGNLSIGKNFTCLHHVTIGNDGHTSDSMTTIGNNCYIGAGAKIFGGVTIGNDVTIGGGAVVLKNIPDGCTVAGVPARVIARKS